MGTVAHALSGETAWEDNFDDAEQAKAYASRLGRQVDSLRSIVRLAIDAALDRLRADGTVETIYAKYGISLRPPR